jgi:hypothetical protein
MKNMPHYRSLYPPSDFLGPQDFPAPGREVTISRVALAEMPEREGKKKEKAACLWITAKDGSEYPRRLKLPKSFIFALSELLGPDYDQWAGKKITLVSAHCLAFGDVEECVRPVLPNAINDKVSAWLKRRNSSPRAWMCNPKAPV